MSKDNKPWPWIYYSYWRGRMPKQDRNRVDDHGRAEGEAMNTNQDETTVKKKDLPKPSPPNSK